MKAPQLLYAVALGGGLTAAACSLEPSSGTNDVSSSTSASVASSTASGGPGGAGAGGSVQATSSSGASTSSSGASTSSSSGSTASSGGSAGGGGAAQGGGGQGGEGGSAPCTTYGGDGCTPGDSMGCGLSDPFEGLVEFCYEDPTQQCVTYWDSSGCDTPLVLSFDGAPVAFRADREHGFDLSGEQSIVTDWPTSRTPWLAIDLDGNGRIDDGSELFGSMTRLANGTRAVNGFVALRELDADGDGKITANDPGFAKLLVWRDDDGDRASTSSELTPASLELVSIDLDYGVDRRCDGRGNCEVERASFVYRDASGALQSGAIIDVHLAAQE